MPAAVAVILSLILGSAVTGPLTAVQIAALAGIAIKDLPKAIALQKQVNAYLESPAFRQMLAANGEAAIRWQDRQMEY